MTVMQYLKLTSEMQARNGRPKGYFYSSQMEFGLAHGKLMRPSPVPLPIRVKLGESRQCFKNATELAMEGKGFLYCEGWAASVLPVQHAWNLVEHAGELHVIDTTWKQPAQEYFGIVFKTAYLTHRLARQKYYGLIDACDVDWPLLRLPPDKAHRWKHPLMDKLKHNE